MYSSNLNKNKKNCKNNSLKNCYKQDIYIELYRTRKVLNFDFSVYIDGRVRLRRTLGKAGEGELVEKMHL